MNEKQYWLKLPARLEQPIKDAAAILGHGYVPNVFASIVLLREALEKARESNQAALQPYLADDARYTDLRVEVAGAWRHIIWFAEWRNNAVFVPYTVNSYLEFRRLRAAPRPINYTISLICTPAWVMIDGKKYAVKNPTVYIARTPDMPFEAYPSVPVAAPMITETYHIERFGMALTVSDLWRIPDLYPQIQYALRRQLMIGGGVKRVR